MYPAHIAKQHGSNEASFTWFQSNPLPVSGGPFVVSSVSSDHTSVILKANPKYYGKKPYLDQITFRAITDSSQEPTALQNREVDGIYPQPQTNLVTQLKNMGSQIRYQIDSGLSFEHIDFNLKNPALGNATWGKTLRTAMFTATDRNAILSKTIQQFQPSAVPLNSRMMVPGQNGYQDNVSTGSAPASSSKARVAAHGRRLQGRRRGQGRAQGPGRQQVSRRRFQMKSTPPAIKIRQDTCTLFASEMAQLGITVDVSPTDNLGATLSQSGNGYSYDIIDFAWVARPLPARRPSSRSSPPAAAATTADIRTRPSTRWLNTAKERDLGQRPPRTHRPQQGRPADQPGRLHPSALPEAGPDRLLPERAQRPGQHDLDGSDVQRRPVGSELLTR